MMEESDRPTTDSAELFEADGGNSKSVAVIQLSEIETDGEGDEDIHYCKKCQKAYTSIEAYLEHKIRHDNYKVKYQRWERDRRMVLPTLVQKKPKGRGAALQRRGALVGDPLSQQVQAMAPGEDRESQTSGQGAPHPPTKSRRGRKKKETWQVNTELIAERSSYICEKCNRKFNREASLRWHMEYDHREPVEGEEELSDENDAGEDDENYNVRLDMEGRRQARYSEEDLAARPFACEICGFRFKDMAVLKTHMLVHTDKRTFPCPYEGCSYSFKTKGSLTRHQRRHTGERPFTCDLCNRKFTESGALTRHLKSRTPCTKKTDAELPRYGARWRFSAGSPRSNPDLGEGEVVTMTTTVLVEGDSNPAGLDVVASNEEVAMAMQTEVQDDVGTETLELETEDFSSLMPTQCRVCRVDLMAMDTLRLHLQTHLADTPFRCGLCHFVSDQRQELQEHMISQHQTQLKGLEPSAFLPPDPSTTTTANSAALKRAAQVAVKQLIELPMPSESQPVPQEPVALSEPRGLHRCPVCQRSFRGSSYLRQHMKSHTGDRPHRCDVCKKTFTTRDALTKHLSVHSDERQYKCGVCHKLFKRISHVREHLKIHSTERPYGCGVCHKSFKSNNARKVHLRTHNSILPYICTYCQRRFRERGSLQRHKRSHTGERPFKCPHCHRGFAEHGTLNRHLRAKVPCAQQLQLARLQQSGSQGLWGGIRVESGSQEGEGEVLETVEEEGEQMELGGEGGQEATVLAQFSSMVADTQQYILPSHHHTGSPLSAQEPFHQTTELVVVQTDTGEQGEHGAGSYEIIAEGDLDPALLEQVGDTTYMILNDGNLQVLSLPANVTMAQTNTIQCVAMAPEDCSMTMTLEEGLTSTTLEGGQQVVEEVEGIQEGLEEQGVVGEGMLGVGVEGEGVEIADMESITITTTQDVIQQAMKEAAAMASGGEESTDAGDQA